MGMTAASVVLARSMSEAQLTKAVIDRARELGWLVYHPLPAPAPDRDVRYTTRYQGDKGYTDLTMARGGRLLLVELKAEGGRPSPEQVTWLSVMSDGRWQWDARLPGLLVGSLVRVGVWRPRDWFSGVIEEELRTA